MDNTVQPDAEKAANAIPDQGKRKTIFVVVLIAIAIGLVSLLLSDIRKSWEEDVLLSNGGVIRVKREAHAERFGELGQIGQSTYWAIDVKGANSFSWSSDVRPIILDIKDGVVFVVAEIGVNYRNCQKYGFPNPPYLFFRLQKGSEKWEQVTAKEVPSSLSYNLLLSVWKNKSAIPQTYISIDEKKTLDVYSLRDRPSFDPAKQFPHVRSCASQK